jgi:hypothetical protein
MSTRTNVNDESMKYEFDEFEFKKIIVSSLIETDNGLVHDTEKLFAIFSRFYVILNANLGKRKLLLLDYTCDGENKPPVEVKYGAVRSAYKDLKITILDKSFEKPKIKSVGFFDAWAVHKKTCHHAICDPRYPFGEMIEHTHSKAAKRQFNTWVAEN